MNWILVAFMFGIMIGMFIGVQEIVGKIYKAVMDVLRQQNTRKKNRRMY